MTTATETEHATNVNGDEPKELTLPQKILAVQRAIKSIDKDGRNDFHKYDYATAENILRSVREPLAENGVLLLADLTEISERQRGNSTITTVHICFTFIDAESGSRLDLQWAGTGDDPSDKGLYKAYTGAIKTFLREQFLLPLGDDPEGDKRADERAAAQKAEAGPRKLNEDESQRLFDVIKEANLHGQLPVKLRGIGVDNLGDLTTEQAIEIYEWARNDG